MSLQFGSLAEYQAFIATLPRLSSTIQLPSMLKKSNVYIPSGTWYLVDVALSGMTYAQLEAADLALFTSLFGTGGRLNGDTWAMTNPAGSLA